MSKTVLRNKLLSKFNFVVLTFISKDFQRSKKYIFMVRIYPSDFASEAWNNFSLFFAVDKYPISDIYVSLERQESVLGNLTGISLGENGNTLFISLKTSIDRERIVFNCF